MFFEKFDHIAMIIVKGGIVVAMTFDFEEFGRIYPSADEGLKEVQKVLTDLGPRSVEIAREIGADLFIKTTESYADLCENTKAMIESVDEAAAGVHKSYLAMNASTNG